MTPEEQETKRIAARHMYNLDHMYDEVEPTRPLALFDDDIVFIVTGQSPMSGTHKGLQNILEGYAEKEKDILRPPAGYGAYAMEWIVEGNRAVMICRVRLENKKGVPYNNTYFMLFEVENGKLVRMFEDMDLSLGTEVGFDMHLEPI